MAGIDYKDSGVNIDAGNEVVRRIKSLARGTYNSNVLSGIGSFGGLFCQWDPGHSRARGIEFLQQCFLKRNQYIIRGNSLRLGNHRGEFAKSASKKILRRFEIEDNFGGSPEFFPKGVINRFDPFVVIRKGWIPLGQAQFVGDPGKFGCQVKIDSHSPGFQSARQREPCL